MQPSTRRRQTAAPHAATFKCRSSVSTETEATAPPKPRFHLDLWLGFTVQNWVLDVGRPVVMLALPADWFPLNRPGAAEFLHLLYNISTPLLLLELLDRSPRTPPRLAVHLGVAAVATGTSFHLVAEAVTRRLVLIGYRPHLSVRDDPAMKDLKPSSVVDLLELLFYFDHTLGHLMWYVPLFLVLFLFFSGCFCHRKQQEEKMQTAEWTLLIPNAVYYWYLVAQGQTFILFIFTFFAMAATVMHQRRRGLVPDGNGLFMLYSFSAALLLVAVWVYFLWGDGVLRRKHPGLIYVPQPLAVYTLHLRPGGGGPPTTLM